MGFAWAASAIWVACCIEDVVEDEIVATRVGRTDQTGLANITRGIEVKDVPIEPLSSCIELSTMASIKTMIQRRINNFWRSRLLPQFDRDMDAFSRLYRGIVIRFIKASKAIPRILKKKTPADKHRAGVIRQRSRE